MSRRAVRVSMSRLIPRLTTASWDRVGGRSHGPMGVAPGIYLGAVSASPPRHTLPLSTAWAPPCAHRRAFLPGKYREVDRLGYRVRARPVGTFIAEFTSNTDASSQGAACSTVLPKVNVPSLLEPLQFAR